MGSMKDQLGGELYDTRYPSKPGYKEGSTSRQAAQALANSAGMIRYKVLREIGASPGTADEIADRLKLSVLTVRPRVSELRAQFKIEDTGERRKNTSGCSAKVWRKKP